MQTANAKQMAELAHRLQDDLHTVRAMIPLGETFAYTTALRSLSRGRATFTMEFKHYEPVPQGVLKTLINVG